MVMNQPDLCQQLKSITSKRSLWSKSSPSSIFIIDVVVVVVVVVIVVIRISMSREKTRDAFDRRQASEQARLQSHYTSRISLSLLALLSITEGRMDRHIDTPTKINQLGSKRYLPNISVPQRTRGHRPLPNGHCSPSNAHRLPLSPTDSPSGPKLRLSIVSISKSTPNSLKERVRIEEKMDIFLQLEKISSMRTRVIIDPLGRRRQTRLNFNSFIATHSLLLIHRHAFSSKMQ